MKNKGKQSRPIECALQAVVASIAVFMGSLCAVWLPLKIEVLMQIVREEWNETKRVGCHVQMPCTWEIRNTIKGQISFSPAGVAAQTAE